MTAPERNREVRASPLTVIMILTIAGAVLWALWVLTKNPSIPGKPTDIEISALLKKDEENYPVLGNLQAKVTVTIFTDFACHSCKLFAETVEPAIIGKYVKAGRVKLVFRDFPFLGKESSWAAEAVHCANDQGKYKEYAAKLHALQEGHNPTVFSRENLKRLSQETGLEINQFSQCFDSGKYARLVKESLETGKDAGVRGTPTVFVNDKKIEGAQSLLSYELALEKEIGGK